MFIQGLTLRILFFPLLPKLIIHNDLLILQVLNYKAIVHPTEDFLKLDSLKRLRTTYPSDDY